VALCSMAELLVKATDWNLQTQGTGLESSSKPKKNDESQIRHKMCFELFRQRYRAQNSPPSLAWEDGVFYAAPRVTVLIGGRGDTR